MSYSFISSINVVFIYKFIIINGNHIPHLGGRGQIWGEIDSTIWRHCFIFLLYDATRRKLLKVREKIEFLNNFINTLANIIESSAL